MTKRRNSRLDPTVFIYRLSFVLGDSICASSVGKKIMSSTSLQDTLIYLKKKLERTTDEDGVIHIIHKLSKFPITIDLLQVTGAGKIMRTLAKKPGAIGNKASSVLNKWRDVVASSEKALNTKQNKHSKLTSNDEDCSNTEVSNELFSQPSKHELYTKGKSVKEKHSKEKFKEKYNSKKYIEKPVKEKHAKINFNLAIENHVTNKHSKGKQFMKPNHEESNDIKRSFEENKIDNYTKEHNSSSKYSCYTSEKVISNSLSDLEYYDPNNPEIYPKCKGKWKNNNTEIIPNGGSTIYKPSKKSKLSESDFSNNEHHGSKTKKNKAEYSQSPSLDSTLSKHAQKHLDHSHKKKTSKDVKSDIKENGHLKSKSTTNFNETKPKNKNSSSQLQVKKSPKKGLNIKPIEVFTSSEATFEDCLSFNDIVPAKKKKCAKSTLNPVTKKIKESPKKDVMKSKVKSCPSPNFSFEQEKKACDMKKIKEPIMQIPIPKRLEEVDIISTLPQTLPNYRPLPQRSYESGPVKKKVLSNEEAIKFTSSRREKTAVYSGRKNCFSTEVPSLFELCTRVLIDNIDDIEYMGEIPYFLLESMLQRCTASQLYKIENYNPYLLEDTNELWEKHCKRDYRSSKPQESETWRDLYLRTHDEQEQKLKHITANITASIANSNPVRKAKLAYIDAVVKPPRDVARRQAKHGTALPTNHSVKAGPPSKASARPTAPAINAASTSRAQPEYKPQKPKVAPLMAKTLKSMKQCFRR